MHPQLLRKYLMYACAMMTFFSHRPQILTEFAKMVTYLMCAIQKICYCQKVLKFTFLVGHGTVAKKIKF